MRGALCWKHAPGCRTGPALGGASPRPRLRPADRARATGSQRRGGRAALLAAAPVLVAGPSAALPHRERVPARAAHPAPADQRPAYPAAPLRAPPDVRAGRAHAGRSRQSERRCSTSGVRCATLHDHIRWEERELFETAQAVLTEQELDALGEEIAERHPKLTSAPWEDGRGSSQRDVLAEHAGIAGRMHAWCRSRSGMCPRKSVTSLRSGPHRTGSQCRNTFMPNWSDWHRSPLSTSGCVRFASERPA